jgi:hypothetical protein
VNHEFLAKRSCVCIGTLGKKIVKIDSTGEETLHEKANISMGINDPVSITHRPAIPIRSPHLRFRGEAISPRSNKHSQASQFFPNKVPLDHRANSLFPFISDKVTKGRRYEGSNIPRKDAVVSAEYGIVEGFLAEWF